MALSGKIFAITGTLSAKREHFESMLKSNGGQIEKSLTKKVTHLIVGSCRNKESKKTEKARKNGIQIISEDNVLSMINNHIRSSSSSSSSNRNELPSTKAAAAVAAAEVIDVDDDGDAFDNDDENKPPPLKKQKKTSTTITTAVGGFGDLADGETYEVEGSNGAIYKIKNVGGVYSCTCPGWKFQKGKKSDERTCKHIKTLRGDSAEGARLAHAAGGSATSSTSTNKKKKATKNVACAPAAAAANDDSIGGLYNGKDIMLADKWNHEKHVPDQYLMSEKLDGMRALWDGNKLVSRQGNVIDAPDFFIEGLPSNLALDGELFGGRGEFQSTVGIARRKNGGELWRQLKYVVFDAPTADGGFERRLARAKAAVAPLEFAEIHPHTECRDMNQLNQELERIENLGGEGLMMRKKGSGYTKGRSKQLLKVKTFIDDEAIVVGMEFGNGRNSERMGALLCKLRDGTDFKVGSGFTDAEREDPPPDGTVITFRYFELTKQGVPRFPSYQRLRPDVDPAEFAIV